MKTISWKVEEGIGHLVMDAPPSNTMNGRFFGELYELTHGILPASGIRALVVYGSGRHFSAGADPAELVSRVREGMPEGDHPGMPAFLEQNRASFECLSRLEMPTFAAIRGSCLGSALELALVCRYRVCGEGSVFGFPETSFGLMPGCGGTVRLPAITGKARAIELILGGRNFSAEEALSWGIVHQIVPRKDVIGHAIKMAVKLTRLHEKS